MLKYTQTLVEEESRLHTSFVLYYHIHNHHDEEDIGLSRRVVLWLSRRNKGLICKAQMWKIQFTDE